VVDASGSLEVVDGVPVYTAMEIIGLGESDVVVGTVRWMGAASAGLLKSKARSAWLDFILEDFERLCVGKCWGI
jgi:hypothetical protein